MEKVRDLNIDVLRALGLLLIILAHVHPPFWLNQFRCFDVPMMMFVSGLAITTHIQSISWGWLWLWKRVKRLVFPVWIFLTLYFCLLYLAHTVVPFRMPTVRTIIESFLLLDGIGYVWVIRVFLILAVLTPFLCILYEKCCKNDTSLSILLILWGGVQSFLCFMSEYYMVDAVCAKVLYGQYILYAAYGIPFLIGLHLGVQKQNVQKVLLWLTPIALLFLLWYLYRYGLSIALSPDYKYPPQSYYLVWGCFMSVVCWTVVRKYGRFLQNSFLLFVGQNTIWIYLWHIPLVLFANKFCDIWWLKWMGIATVAIFLCFLQQRLVVWVERCYGALWFCKYLKG